MTPTRLMTLLAAVAAAGPAVAEQPEPPDPNRPKVVLRMSRAFVESLTRQTFDEVTPVATTQKGATITGTTRVSGGYSVAFLKSQTEAAFELHVNGVVDADLGVARRPVCVQLDGHAALTATRRVSFDGVTYAGGPVAVQACYQSTLEGVGTLRRGLLSPVIRRVARPIALRALPEADRAASGEVRTRTRDKVLEETDPVVEILNAVHVVRKEVTDKLRDRGLGLPAEDRPALATTDDALLSGFGFPAGSPPTLPAAAGGPSAPVEIWVYHPLTAAQRLALERARPEVKTAWEEKVKPRLAAQLARHSPELARRLEDATHEVDIDVAGAPGWHRIRFFKELHSAAPAAP
jgi:hypothetical protein